MIALRDYSTSLLDRLLDIEMPSKYYTVGHQVIELDDTFEILIELPGVKKDDISIDLDKGQLVITAEKANPYDGKRVLSDSRSYGKTITRYTLGSLVDRDGITADLKDGILTVSLKKGANATTKKILIQS